MNRLRRGWLEAASLEHETISFREQCDELGTGSDGVFESSTAIRVTFSEGARSRIQMATLTRVKGLATRHEINSKSARTSRP
jgi:hypothetical protein